MNKAKLLEIDKRWLIDYLAEMIAERDTEFTLAIETQDRRYLEGIIERYIYG